MASTYSGSIRIELPATGEKSGLWGAIVNTNMELLEDAIDGYVSVAMADANTTLSTANGSTDEARNKVVNATGAHTAVRDLIIPAQEKVYIVKNATTGGYAITVKVSGQTGADVPYGETRLLFCDGTTTYSTGSPLPTTYAAASTSFSPSSSDAAALGTTSLMWSDLFLASGSVINWNNGDVTLTHAANTLTFAGASSGYVFDAVIKPSSNDGFALGVSGTAFSDLFLASGAVINFNAGNYTLTHSAGALTANGAFSVGSAAITSGSHLVSSNDAGALGASGTAWADLFLASGGVINWNAGNATLTHSASLLTSNVAFSVGTSNAITAGTIELGAASDTTLSRSSAGIVAVEGVALTRVNSTDADSLLDTLGTETQGALLYHNGTSWVMLAPP